MKLPSPTYEGIPLWRHDKIIRRTVHVGISVALIALVALWVVYMVDKYEHPFWPTWPPECPGFCGLPY